MSTPKICFYALATYPLLSQTNLGFVGGAELQQVLIGNELVKNGYDVSFIVFDHGQKPFEIINGIKIYKTVPKGYVLSGLKSLYPAIKTTWNALKQVDADIYYQRGAGRDTGFISLFCLLKRKKFVWSIAHDMDVDGTRLCKAKIHERILYKFGVKRADTVIAQSKYQQELIKKNFGKDNIILKSLHILPEAITKKTKPPLVLWVSRMQDWKQPEIFLELATAIPEVKFQMVGGASGDKKFYEQILYLASKIPNLDFIGFVPYPEVNQYFSKASLFINTSTAEGFPNTFLQAWARNTPVVSLNVDPDEIICKYNLGVHSKTVEQMIKDVKTLLRDERLREVMSMNGRMYIEREHDIKRIMGEYARVFRMLLE